MTVILQIGRRVPKRWTSRIVNKVTGLISFQENIWLMISMGLNQAKKQITALNSTLANPMIYVQEKFTESEDMRYNIEWIKIMMKGTKEQEEEEFNKAHKLYDELAKVMKDELPKDENLSRQFKTKVVDETKLNEIYTEGYKSLSSSNIAKALLEMGILTDIEWI